MQDEIASNTDALWSLEAFHERYGMENTPSFFNVNEVLTACDTAVVPLIEQYEIATRLPAYTRRQWLLNHLADVPIEKGGLNLPDTFYDELQERLQEVFISRKAAVDSFLETVRLYIHRKKLEQNISHFKGLIINLLEILARLKKHQVAIRDLKPENVFVVSISPQSLPDPASSNAYPLGLIDFETSVNLDPRQPSGIKQPMLAGTPYYATPASIFENRILIMVYQNLPLVYRLQDWYSTMAMLYEIVVGERLFEETGRMLPKIVQIKQKNLGAGIHPHRIYTHVSRLFWETAEAEFRQKVDEHRQYLDTIRPVLPGTVADMLVDESRMCIDLVKKAIEKRIGTQRMFDGSESRNILYKASSAGIRRYRRKWTLNHGEAPAGGKVRKRIIRFLKQLESEKATLENLERTLDSLTHMPLKRSVGDLLEIMFQLVSGCLVRIPN